MSVQNQTVKNVYAGNGSTTVFPFTFALNAADGSHVGVYVTNDVGVSEATDNFTIDTVAKTVTYPTVGDPLPLGKKIVIRREIPNEQELNLENLGPFFAEDVEDEMDREVMMIQQLQEAVDRSIKVDQASDTKPDELIAELFEASADAVASAAAAKISEDNAALSETAAGNSATAAANSETAAGNSATAAGNSATAAYNSQVAAAASETNAGNSATAANNSKIAAASSETNAGNSATAAGNSATAAGNSATAAHNSEVAAKASEDAAAQSAAEAQGINYLVRKNSTAYAAGAIAFYQTIPSPLVLECTTAGTTASTAPDFSGAVEGGTVTDGTVVWTYKSILSGGGVAVGFIMPYAGTGLQEGWLDCDGSAVSRTMYPDLFAAIGTTWGAGDGSTTFNLPRSEDLVFQGASATNPVGTYKSAGLPNIEGDVGVSVLTLSARSSASGCFISTIGNTGASSSSSGRYAYVNFDASQSDPIYGASDTVQPPAACVRFMIKAFDGQTPDSALIDITQYAQDLAKRLTREQTPAFNHRDVVTTSGTYTAPVTGWYKITVKGGGGGGGTGAAGGSGSGGGEGGTTIGFEHMTAGDSVAVVIGGGGTAGSPGNNGGDSSVTVNNNTYTGGGGGGGIGAGTYKPGMGGSGTIPGAPGGIGIHIGVGTQGDRDNAGGSGGGAGGGNGSRSQAPTSGTQGGGGAGGSSYSGNYTATAGGDGYVWFEFFAAV